jgi:poly(A) polymerase
MGAEMSRQMLDRWRCSRKAVWHVSTLVRHHLRPSQVAPAEEGGAPTERALYRYWRDLEGVAADIVFLSLADFLAARGPELDIRSWTKFARTAGVILTAGFVTPSASKPFLLLDGNEIMGEFGLRPGPAVGRLLAALREAETQGEVQDRTQALEFLRRLVREKPSG